MLLNCGIGEDSWESLGLQEIHPVHPKGYQSWVFIGRTDSEAETPILWPPDVKTWVVWKDPSSGKDWRWEEKGTTEDEMVGWHHRLSGHELGWTPGAGGGQGSLACCSQWSRKESDTTQQLNSKRQNLSTLSQAIVLPSGVLCPVSPESLLYVSNKSLPTLLLCMRYQWISNPNFGWGSILCLQGDYNRKNDSCQRFM